MLVIDNYDSFTYNIVQYLEMLDVEPIVIKNDELILEEIKKLEFTRVLISPGWGNPDNSGITMEVIDYFKDSKSILGVCLGMQCIAKYYGSNIVKAKEPMHGKTSKIYFDEGFKLFKNMPQGFEATRYHSLVIADKKNDDFDVVAKTVDDVPMAIKVKNKDIYGVQFHPEAILTENGIKIFENWINL